MPPLPKNTNPATWMLDVLKTPAAAAAAAPAPDSAGDTAAAAAAPPAEGPLKSPEPSTAAVAVVEPPAAGKAAAAAAPPPQSRFADIFLGSDLAERNSTDTTAALLPAAGAEAIEALAKASHYAAPFSRQIAAIMQRHWRETLRVRDYTAIRLFILLFLGLFCEQEASGTLAVRRQPRLPFCRWHRVEQRRGQQDVADGCLLHPRRPRLLHHLHGNRYFHDVRACLRRTKTSLLVSRRGRSCRHRLRFAPAHRPAFCPIARAALQPREVGIVLPP